MSIFSVNKGAKYAAQTAEAQASQEQNTLQLMDFGRDLLQNIRQERIAASQLAFANHIEGVNTSSAAGAASNVRSGLASEVGYAYRYSQHLEDYQNYNRIATEQWEKYAKSVKKAKTNATIAVAAAGALTGGLAGLAGGGALAVGLSSSIGSMFAAGGVSAIGDNSIAGNAAWSQALKTTASSMSSAALQSFMAPAAPTVDVTGTASSGANVAMTNASYIDPATAASTANRLQQVTGVTNTAITTSTLNTGVSTLNGIPLSSMSWSNFTAGLGR